MAATYRKSGANRAGHLSKCRRVTENGDISRDKIEQLKANMSKDFEEWGDEGDDPSEQTTDNESKPLNEQELEELAKEKKYPTEIDLDSLKTRASHLVEHCRKVIRGECEESIYYKIIKDYSETSERARINRLSIVSDDVRTPVGYYGPKGADAIAYVLSMELDKEVQELQRDWMAKFVTPELLIELILVPEVTIKLIQEDRKIDYNEAATVLKDSTQYGNFKFPEFENTLEKEAKEETSHSLTDESDGDDSDLEDEDEDEDDEEEEDEDEEDDDDDDNDYTER